MRYLMKKKTGLPFNGKPVLILIDDFIVGLYTLTIKDEVAYDDGDVDVYLAFSCEVLNLVK